ncbi:MAG: hypothetical protein AAF492_11360 [Verrucomicrobiota bacterium]
MKTVRWMLMALLLPGVAAAKTKNGNDFALYFSECKTQAEMQELLDEASQSLEGVTFLPVDDSYHYESEVGSVLASESAREWAR